MKQNLWYAFILFRRSKKKKEVGLFLDEEGDSYQIMALVGLCAKSYCYIKKNLKTGTYSTVIKGKGVSNKYLTNLYDYQDYLNTAKGL
jgi:hypothetical protein